jgi:FkbM family methyltransferase
MRFHYRRWIGVLEHEMSVALSYVRPGSTVADVGANDGMYAYALAAKAGRVEAFEPIPRCASVVEAYARGNPRISVHRVAISDSAGRLWLRIPVRNGRTIDTEASLAAAPGAGGGGGEWEQREIEVRPLDSFGLTDLSLLKIDVEGHELEVIRGARETLARERPVLMVEIERRHLAGRGRSMEEVFGEIASHGYTGWSAGEDGRMLSIGEFDVERDQVLTAVREPGEHYVNDFFWIPRERS